MRRLRTINKEMLRKLTRSKKYGAKELADAVGCSVNTVNNWLRPDYEWGLEEYSAAKAAEFYSVEVDELFPKFVRIERRSAS